MTKQEPLLAASATSSRPARKPITHHDIVEVKGKYLYVGGGGGTNDDGSTIQRRFFIRGIAFPPPPPPTATTTTDHQHNSNQPQPAFNLTGWNAVLDQLFTETDINVVRVYEMDCNHDYTPFLHYAAQLGIYVIVPFTSRSGDGVLSRDAHPPKCYPRKLYEYGKTCVERYWDVPNVLAGVVGNEVMNNLLTWRSAPCLKAYVDDLTKFIQSKEDDVGGGTGVAISTTTTAAAAATTTATTATAKGRTSPLPLMYATQHDSPSAELHPDDAMKLTLDYLSCGGSSSSNDDDGDEYENSNSFMFGINIESWCSSLQTFDYEEDGVTESSYHSLYATLSGSNKTKEVVDPLSGESITVPVPPVSSMPVTVPIIFSEMGCDKTKFNRDNDVQPKHVRDWKQVSLVASENGKMADVFSGFVSYAYDGGGLGFRMMGGKDNWDGVHTLPKSTDYDNFRFELAKAIRHSNGTTTKRSTGGGDVGGDGVHDATSSNSHRGTSSSSRSAPPLPSSSCDETVATLKKVWRLDLYPMSRMPSHYSDVRGFFHLKQLPFVPTAARNDGSSVVKHIFTAGIVLSSLLLAALFLRRYYVHKRRHRKEEQLQQQQQELVVEDGDRHSDERSRLLASPRKD